MSDATLNEELRSQAAPLLQRNGFGPGASFRALTGGANNQVWHVQEGASESVLKAYFHDNGSRNRLASDYGFSQFAWQSGLRQLPQPIDQDSSNQLALFEFIAGRRLAPGEIDQTYVNDALQFIEDINQHRYSSLARSLPTAAESCLSIQDHLGCVARRVERLQRIDPAGDVHQDALRFVRETLAPAFFRAEQELHNTAGRLGLDVRQSLNGDALLLSPSDFGFHNALAVRDSLVFFDFEYAGWDDSAKLICDFFCQPAIPVPFRFFEGFRKRVCNLHSHADQHIKRAALLLPLYHLKWSCIVMNEFLPAGQSRRQHAGTSNRDDQLSAQLEKAREKVKGFELLTSERTTGTAA